MDKRWIYLGIICLVLVTFFQRSSAIVRLLDEDDEDNSWRNRCRVFRPGLKNGRVKIRSGGRVAKFQCDSGYELAGDRFATCVRGQWNNPIPICVARGCNRRPNVLNSRVSETMRGALLTYECLPGYTLTTGSNTIYCDGRRWSQGTPKCEVTTLDPKVSCDFEATDLCGWSHDPTHDFDWRRNQYKTPSGHLDTGPTFDHTFGVGRGGMYLYMETSSPRKQYDTARLFSPVYAAELSDGCFTFWYHMYGRSTGGLRVYVKPTSQVFGELTPAWERFGAQGNAWFQGNVTVPGLEESFQIVIEGIRGDGYEGDTAIDDVNLNTENCRNIENSNETESDLDAVSCRGRCEEPKSDVCGCDADCVFERNCCPDYRHYCSPNTDSKTENPDERQRLSSSTTTTEADIHETAHYSFLPTTASGSPLNITSSSSVTETVVSLKTTPTSISSSTISSSTDTVLNTTVLSTTTTQPPITVLSPTTSSTTATTTTTSLPTTTTPAPTTTTPTPTTTTPAPTTATPAPTTTTPAPITTTPATTTTTPAPTTTSTPSTTTRSTTSTTTTSTPSTTATTSTPSTTTTLAPIPTTMQITPTASTEAVESVSASTALTSTSTTNIVVIVTQPPPEQVTAPQSSVSTRSSSPETFPTTFTVPETRRTYNLRPRNRTTSTTAMPSPRTSRYSTTPVLKSTTPRTSITSIPPALPVPTRSSYATTSTQRSKFKLTTDDVSAYKDAHPSKSASTKQQPIVTILSVTAVVMIGVGAAAVYMLKRRRASKQSKLADDSEMRFLSENEVIEFSDASALDRHNLHQPLI